MMKKTLVIITAITLFSILTAASGASAQDVKWISRYWDGCKPTCAWAQNVPTDSEYGLCKACDINNEELFLGDVAEAVSSCGGGPAYTCWDQIPFVDPDNPLIAYGFGATSNIACGECFEVEFNGGFEHGPSTAMHKALVGKKLILMGRNTGSDVSPNQIDFMVPGGGLGQFDSFSEQLGLPSKFHPSLGKTYGGLLGNCEEKFIQQFNGNWDVDGVIEYFQGCLSEGCNSVFSAPKHSVLLEGCLFYADWMMAANNPQATVKKLEKCPQPLVDKYKPKSSEYTVMVQAESFTSGTGNPNTGNGIHVSGINSGVTLTYNNVTAPHTGEYTLLFSVATREQTVISVNVNGQPAGSTSNFVTSDWGKFESVEFGSKINLTEGNNTIVLSFQTNSVNFDYFILIGESHASVKLSGSRAGNVRSNIALKPANKGFSAVLPNNHGFDSYSLIDLKGREIRSGAVKAGAAELRFSNIRQGIMFLRLKGKNNTTVLKAATF